MHVTAFDHKQQIATNFSDPDNHMKRKSSGLSGPGLILINIQELVLSFNPAAYAIALDAGSGEFTRPALSQAA